MINHGNMMGLGVGYMSYLWVPGPFLTSQQVLFAKRKDGMPLIQSMSRYVKDSGFFGDATYFASLPRLCPCISGI